MPLLTALLAALSVVELAALIRLSRKINRLTTVAQHRRHVGIAPMHVIDIHRRRVDWAANESTMTLPVVSAADEKPERKHRRRRPRRRPRTATVVPGLDAEVIDIAKKISRKIREGTDAS